MLPSDLLGTGVLGFSLALVQLLCFFAFVCPLVEFAAVPFAGLTARPRPTRIGEFRKPTQAPAPYQTPVRSAPPAVACARFPGTPDPRNPGTQEPGAPFSLKQAQQDDSQPSPRTRLRTVHLASYYLPNPSFSLAKN